MTKRLYYVQCVAKFGHGTEAEIDVKEYSRQYDAMVVDSDKLDAIVRQLADYAYNYWVDHPTSRLVKVVYSKKSCTTYFPAENKNSGNNLLKALPIRRICLSSDKEIVLRDGDEFEEEEE